jgi:hypothetical protein
MVVAAEVTAESVSVSMFPVNVQGTLHTVG